MGHVKRVVGALIAHREAGDAAVLANRGKAIAPAGEYLVAVCLVADVPDNLVLGCVEGVVQREGQFHRAKTGCQVTAGLGDYGHEVVAQFFGDSG